MFFLPDMATMLSLWLCAQQPSTIYEDLLRRKSGVTNGLRSAEVSRSLNRFVKRAPFYDSRKENVEKQCEVTGRL